MTHVERGRRGGGEGGIFIFTHVNDQEAGDLIIRKQVGDNRYINKAGLDG